MAGRLERIWRKRCRRGPMDARSRVELRAGAGRVDDAKQSRTWQVTSVSRERWKAVAEALGQHVDPVLRRANLLISGVDLENSHGNIPRVGSGRLRVNGETRPCERMDAPLPGWRAERRHRWGGGVYASVLADGKIAVGGPVEGARAAPRPSSHCVVGVRRRGDAAREAAACVRADFTDRFLARTLTPRSQVRDSRGAVSPDMRHAAAFMGAAPSASANATGPAGTFSIRPARGRRAATSRPHSLSSVASERSRIPRRPRGLLNGWALRSATSSMTVSSGPGSWPGLCWW